MPRVILSLVVALSLAPVALASRENRMVRAQLDRVLPDVKLTNVALRDCIEFLRDISAANIHVDWRALERAGITPETLINIRLRNVTLRKVLTTALGETGAAGAVTFYVDQGVITVTTREIADRQMITKTYYVEDLLFEVPDYVSNASMNLNDSQAVRGGRSGYDSGGAFTRGGIGIGAGSATTPGGGVAGTSKVDRANALMSMIRDIVEPPIWRENGGTATIRYFNGYLIITAPRSAHEAIGGPID